MVDKTEPLVRGCAPDLCIHIGFPKTATTTLQRALFASSNDVVYLGKSSSSPEGNRIADLITEKLLWESSLSWERQGADLQRRILSCARSLPNYQPGRTILLSDENILNAVFGALQVASRFQQGRPVSVGMDTLALRLGALANYCWTGGKVRVLISVRRQDQFLGSFFAQTLLWRRRLGLHTLESFVERVIDSDYFAMGGYSLEYDALVETLESHLGKGAVEILVYEDIAAAPEAFSASLWRATGIQKDDTANVMASVRFKDRARGASTWETKRYASNNRVRNGLEALRCWTMGEPNPARVAMPPSLSRVILERYRESNRRLAARLGRDLSIYGYMEEARELTNSPPSPEALRATFRAPDPAHEGIP